MALTHRRQTRSKVSTTKSPLIVSQHRVESFSDMIMGFSVALLGLTLVIPAHTIALFREPAWILVYCWNVRRHRVGVAVAPAAL